MPVGTLFSCRLKHRYSWRCYRLVRRSERLGGPAFDVKGFGHGMRLGARRHRRGSGGSARARLPQLVIYRCRKECSDKLWLEKNGI